VEAFTAVVAAFTVVAAVVVGIDKQDSIV
jgi:hypothetical protein